MPECLDHFLATLEEKNLTDSSHRSWALNQIFLLAAPRMLHIKLNEKTQIQVAVKGTVFYKPRTW